MTVKAGAPSVASSVTLTDLSWLEAEQWLTPEALVLIPLGAAAKEHGPHLRLDNDRRLAEALAARVMVRTAVVLAPTVGFHHYPAFTEYPGSISLRFETARDLLVDIVGSLAAHGPRRFYVLNTGISTLGPLKAAAGRLEAASIVLAYPDVSQLTADVESELAQQTRGSHADEIETSMMLYLAPERVDMRKAARDDAARSGPGGFHRAPGRPGIHSPSGVWGDPALADVDKGRRLVEAAVEAIVRDIEQLRRKPA